MLSRAQTCGPFLRSAPSSGEKCLVVREKILLHNPHTLVTWRHQTMSLVGCNWEKRHKPSQPEIAETQNIITIFAQYSWTYRLNPSKNIALGWCLRLRRHKIENVVWGNLIHSRLSDLFSRCVGGLVVAYYSHRWTHKWTRWTPVQYPSSRAPQL